MHLPSTLGRQGGEEKRLGREMGRERGRERQTERNAFVR